MSVIQQNHLTAMLRASGFEDGTPLTLQSTEGDIPLGRELSLSWLAGVVMTGLTSVLLMGAALYVAFQGQDTFSTPYEALQIENRSASLIEVPTTKTSRLIPITQTISEREIIQASIRVDDGELSRIRKQPFDRIRATLATTATSLSSNIPLYDPVALLNRTRSLSAAQEEVLISTDIYGADVEGEITIQTAALPLDIVPERTISDVGAAAFVRLSLERSYSPFEISALGYAAESSSIIELGNIADLAITGVAQNVTVMTKTTLPGDQVLGRSERILTFKEITPLDGILAQNGFTPSMVQSVMGALRNVYPSPDLPAGSHVRILFGPDRSGITLIPYRTSLYVGDQHAATVALTDSGAYVLGQPPPAIEFQEEDVEEINVNNLPTIYRSIWETARKYELDDETIDQIVALYSYDQDLTRRIAPGDSIEILQSVPNDNGDRELIFVSLTLDGNNKDFFRFRAEDGDVDFYDPSGQTGKRFLLRRPLEGGGNLRSRFGMRTHPIFGTRKLHSGVDLAAPRGTLVYASGDAVVRRAQWVSGFGRFVELQHVNGYVTRYAHMNRIADGLKPGMTVRQGDVIGYVGTTGNSTGNHLHFEVRINDNPVDPLSIQLPRVKSLPARDQIKFAQSVDQVRGLMERDAAPVTVAAN